MKEKGSNAEWDLIRDELNKHQVRKIFKDWQGLEKSLDMDEESIKGLQVGIELADGGFRLDRVDSVGEEEMWAFFWTESEDEVVKGNQVIWLR